MVYSRLPSVLLALFPRSPSFRAGAHHRPSRGPAVSTAHQISVAVDREAAFTAALFRGTCTYEGVWEVHSQQCLRPVVG